MHRRTQRPLAFSLLALSLAACGTESPPDVTPGGAGRGAAGTNGAGAGSAGVPTAGLGGASSSGGTAGTGGGIAGGSGAGGAGALGGAGGTPSGGAAGGGSGASGAAGGDAAGMAGTVASGGTGGDGGSPSAGSAGTPPEGGAAGTSAGMTSAGSSGAGGAPSRPARALLYSFSTLDIPSVPAQLAIYKSKLEGFDLEVDESEDPAVFTDANLERYALVGMINTCFSPFGQGRSGEAEGQVLQRFLQAGGGLFGTHCADVTFQSANPPALYNQLLGGRANSENFEGRSDCRTTAEHPTTAALPDMFSYTGNLDNTDYLAPDSTILVRCRWSGGAAKDVAVSWVRTEGLGRVFYTNFAKVDADLTNATVGEPHILAGLAWVLGR
jgi:type 1 glutamine amidotransferase